MQGSDGVLFLVPARGGSKGMKDKNLRLCGGRPLLAYAVEAALAAAARVERPARVVASTDSDAIAQAALAAGAEVPFRRPAELASDEARSEDAVLHAVDALAAEGFHAGTVVLLQPTSPLVAADDIVTALRLHWSSRGKPVISVTELDHPPHRSYRLGDDGRLIPLLPDADRYVRRQDFGDAYRANGAVWIASVDHLRRTRSFVTSETLGYAMPRERSVDIDSELDLAVAELLLRRRADAEVPPEAQEGVALG